MAELHICPIVEGHGEYEAVRSLLERAWREIVGGTHVNVLRPIRQPRGKLVKDEELRRAVTLAAEKLVAVPDDGAPRLVLVLIDAEDDLACELAPRLLKTILTAGRTGIACSCVLANVMYETWFVAAAESLKDFLELEDGDPPADPEGQRCGKGWIKSRIKGAKYSETLDQPAMTARMDMLTARTRARSFDKLCRELEVFKAASSPVPTTGD